MAEENTENEEAGRTREDVGAGIQDPEAHRKAIEATVDRIRPFLVRDGGDCELVDVSEDGKTVYLRLKGACSHCPSAIYTLKLGIEQALRDAVPGVETVEAVP